MFYRYRQTYSSSGTKKALVAGGQLQVALRRRQNVADKEDLDRHRQHGDPAHEEQPSMEPAHAWIKRKTRKFKIMSEISESITGVVNIYDY